MFLAKCKLYICCSIAGKSHFKVPREKSAKKRFGKPLCKLDLKAVAKTVKNLCRAWINFSAKLLLVSPLSRLWRQLDIAITKCTECNGGRVLLQRPLNHEIGSSTVQARITSFLAADIPDPFSGSVFKYTFKLFQITVRTRNCAIRNHSSIVVKDY